MPQDGQAGARVKEQGAQWSCTHPKKACLGARLPVTGAQQMETQRRVQGTHGPHLGGHGERSHHHLPSSTPRGALRRQASPHGTQSQEWPRRRPESPSESHPPLRGRLQLFYLPPGSPHPWKVSSPESLVLGLLRASAHIHLPRQRLVGTAHRPPPPSKKRPPGAGRRSRLGHERPLSPWPRDRSTTHQRPRRGSEAPEGVPPAWSHRWQTLRRGFSCSATKTSERRS